MLAPPARSGAATGDGPDPGSSPGSDGPDPGSSPGCDLCPRLCPVDRRAGELGTCGCPALPPVAHVCLHPWEEPCLSGERGSGAVFFGGCNLSCVFCQNHAISTRPAGRPHAPSELTRLFLDQQTRGAHNLNLVSPTPYSRVIASALREARSGTAGGRLTIPVVYNSNGYETVEALRRLEGLVDIYLPDLKYHGEAPARRLSGAPGYFPAASRAITEMARQVGPAAAFDEAGLMTRGLLVRHLVLPGLAGDSAALLGWLAAEIPGVHLSLMAQYTPVGRVAAAVGPVAAAGRAGYPDLARRVTVEEYEPLLDLCDRLGLDRGYRQLPESADEAYIPPFEPG